VIRFAAPALNIQHLSINQLSLINKHNIINVERFKVNDWKNLKIQYFAYVCEELWIDSQLLRAAWDAG
jgi:hypothetical protein